MKNKILFLMLFTTILFSCSRHKNDIENNCDTVSAITADQTFNAIDTSGYVISNVQLTDNCLSVTVADSGCDANQWEMKLYGSNVVTNPMQRPIKIELINHQECLAFFQKTLSFDLTPFQIPSQNQVTLSIEGWDTPIIYTY